MSTTQGELVAKFAAGVVDTVGKFAAGIVNTGGNLPPVSLTPVRRRWCTLTCEYLCEFSKKFEMILMLLSGAWGKVIHEKNLKQKNLVTLSLSDHYLSSPFKYGSLFLYLHVGDSKTTHVNNSRTF